MWYKQSELQDLNFDQYLVQILIHLLILFHVDDMHDDILWNRGTSQYKLDPLLKMHSIVEILFLSERKMFI